MRIGKLFLTISYVMVLLLSVTRLAGVSLYEGAITYWLDSFFKNENQTAGDSFYYVSYEGANGHDDPRFFDRENAEIIFNAIGVSLD